MEYKLQFLKITTMFYSIQSHSISSDGNGKISERALASPKGLPKNHELMRLKAQLDELGTVRRLPDFDLARFPKEICQVVAFGM